MNSGPHGGTASIPTQGALSPTLEKVLFLYSLYAQESGGSDQFMKVLAVFLLLLIKVKVEL